MQQPAIVEMKSNLVNPQVLLEHFEFTRVFSIPKQAWVPRVLYVQKNSSLCVHNSIEQSSLSEWKNSVWICSWQILAGSQYSVLKVHCDEDSRMWWQVSLCYECVIVYQDIDFSTIYSPAIADGDNHFSLKTVIVLNLLWKIGIKWYLKPKATQKKNDPKEQI
jgi:hypothetical protein